MTDPFDDDEQAALDRTAIVDDRRSCFLDDVGQPDYGAACVIDSDGTSGFVLALYAGLNNPDVRYRCGPAPAHEELGPLPLPILRRLVEVTRAHRNGVANATKDAEVTSSQDGAVAFATDEDTDVA